MQGVLEKGHRFHWYRIDHVLGHGQFGITYRAEDINLHRPVAIKEFFPYQYCSREEDSANVRPLSAEAAEHFNWAMERFLSEARTLAHFEHPNIIRVLNVFEENGTAYMVMHYERGVSLADLLKRRHTLSEDELTKIAKPLLDGLEKVHANGFVHRDIKPSNIFIRKDGTPVLLDFGSARQSIKEHTQDLTRLVSPGYAPMEQYTSNSGSHGPWSDIYGMAAILYRAVTGRVPPSAVDRSEARMNNRNDIVPSSELVPGTYSQDFLTAIDHGLAFRAQDRPQDIATWRQEFGYVDTDNTAATQPEAYAEEEVASDQKEVGNDQEEVASNQKKVGNDQEEVANHQIGKKVDAIIGGWRKGRPANQDPAVATEKIANKVDQILQDWKKGELPNRNPVPAGTASRTEYAELLGTAARRGIIERYTQRGSNPEVSEATTQRGGYRDTSVMSDAYADEMNAEAGTGTAELDDLLGMASAIPESESVADPYAKKRRRHGILYYIIVGGLPIAACGLLAVVLLFLMTDLVPVQEPPQTGAASGSDAGVAAEADDTGDATEAAEDIGVAADSDRGVQTEPVKRPEEPLAQETEQSIGLNKPADILAEPETETPLSAGESESAPATTPGHETQEESQSRSAVIDAERTQRQSDVEFRLEAARADIAAKRLTTPAGNNAYDKYRSILEDDPDNQAAREGLQEILNLYLQIAHASMANGEFTHADIMLRRAAKVDPQDPGLIEAHDRLQTQREQMRSGTGSLSPAVHRNEPSPSAPASHKPAGNRTAPSPPLPAPRHEGTGDRIGPSPPVPASNEESGDGVRTVPSPPLH